MPWVPEPRSHSGESACRVSCVYLSTLYFASEEYGAHMLGSIGYSGVHPGESQEYLDSREVQWVTRSELNEYRCR